MFYKKQGYPEEGEIAVATVKKILYHSVFATLDEYASMEGMIHISEISPGRIRNIRDYVKEGKQIICKILRIDRQKGHIDLSLRRVSTTQRINKTADWKQEQKAEKALGVLGKKLDKSLEVMYKELGHKLIDEYGSLNKSFQRFALDHEELEELKLPKKLEDEITNTILEKIKPKKVEVKGIFEIQLESPNGVEVIKKTLLKLQKGEISITYISAPKYKVSITATDYKTAEGLLKQVQDDATKDIESAGGTILFSKLK
jgi:translation initiation factor 2 subunit 1